MKIHTKKGLEFKEIQDKRIVNFLKEMNIEWEICKDDDTFIFETEYAYVSEYLHASFPDFIKHILERTYIKGKNDMFDILHHRIHSVFNYSMI